MSYEAIIYIIIWSGLIGALSTVIVLWIIEMYKACEEHLDDLEEEE